MSLPAYALSEHSVGSTGPLHALEAVGLCGSVALHYGDIEQLPVGDEVAEPGIACLSCGRRSDRPPPGWVQAYSINDTGRWLCSVCVRSSSVAIRR